MTESLRDFVARRFPGGLSAGAHGPDGQACALEALSQYRGIPWTDDPKILRSLDYRSINDIPVSNALRTEWMVRVMEAYQGSLDWPAEKLQRVADRIVVRTVNRIMAEKPGLPDAVREQCRVARTLDEAAGAATALARAVSAEAAEAAATALARAAKAAAGAALARESVRAAAAAAAVAEWLVDNAELVGAREKVFVAACECWLQAAEEG